MPLRRDVPVSTQRACMIYSPAIDRVLIHNAIQDEDPTTHACPDDYFYFYNITTPTPFPAGTSSTGVTPAKGAVRQLYR